MSDIHRLLDDAFAGVAMTPELQDLKEELRGNLLARADELQVRGADAAAAASTAIAELDVPELIAGLAADAPARPDTDARPGSAADSGSPAPGSAAAGLAAIRRHRVRPAPWFVMTVSILSVLAAAATVGVVVCAFAAPALLPGILLSAALGLIVAALVDVSLRQETARHYRMPSARAAGYGVAGGALAAGLAIGGVFAGHLGAAGALIAGIVLVVVGVLELIALGVTQTNRLKPWALAEQRGYEADDRFSQDPAAAARFGLYTVVIWTLAIAAFVVLSITVGFLWSWLAIVGGFVVFFLVLSRMLFGADVTRKP